jgi:thymidylate kinase
VNSLRPDLQNAASRGTTVESPVPAHGASSERQSHTHASPRPHRGTFIVIVGPDGVGKTTVARAIIDQHSGPSAYFHFLPTGAGGISPRPGDEVLPQPPRLEHRGATLLGWLRLARNVVRWWFGYLVRVRPALRRGCLVISDRWLYGYLVQPTALRFYGPHRVALAAFRLLSRPDLVVNLTALPDIIRQRKQELTLAQIQAELARWSRLPAPRLETFDAGDPPARIAQLVLESVFPET